MDDLQTWRSRIGCFVHRCMKTRSLSTGSTSSSSGGGGGGGQSDGNASMSFGVRLCLLLLIVVCMSVERNPGPREQESTTASTPGKRPSTSTAAPFPNDSSPAQLAAYKLLQNARSPAKTRKRCLASEFPLHEPQVKKQTRLKWTHEADKALVEFLSANCTNLPAYDATHRMWEAAASFIAEKMHQSEREPSSVRSRVCNVIRKKHETLEKARLAFGLKYETETQETHVHVLPDISNLPHEARIALALKALHPLPSDQHVRFANQYAEQLELPNQEATVDAMYFKLAEKKGITSYPSDYATLSTNAMVRLQSCDKPNLVYKFAQCIAQNRPGTEESLMPMTRMPFGLVQHQIEFFTSTNSDQVRNMPEDFRQFQEMMEIEFGTRFNKLFRGPAWSGLPPADRKQPLKAKMNIAATSHVTVTTNISKSAYTTTPEIQEAALHKLKETNPQGRFWIKLDATDIKPAIQESVKGEWNGDADMLDGKLGDLRKKYDERVGEANKKQPNFSKMSEEFKKDNDYLLDELTKAAKLFSQKFSAPGTPDEKLKELSWNLVEISNLLEQAKVLFTTYNNMNGENDDFTKHLGLQADIRKYLTGLFKKKRQPAATHVLVIMLSDEKRQNKPYALPIQYIPYHSLRDVDVRRFTKAIKEKMMDLNMQYVGTVTDGEFSTLRTRGRKPIHIYELIRVARNSVMKLSRKTMEEMILKVGETENGEVQVVKPDKVPQHVLKRLDNLLTEGVEYKAALQLLKKSLVPDGYDPHPWRENVKNEGITDILRSIVATYRFRADVKEMKDKHNMNFYNHLHYPEKDITTNTDEEVREDHNHLEKRVHLHTTLPRFKKIDLGRFHEAMKSSETDLDFVSLQGLRKQSVVDAEKMLSHSVADFFAKKGYTAEAHYVKTIALWHEASDGRGMSQDERSQANIGMLNMILDEWMPWHRTARDFSLIDINVRLKGLCGFSRETVIGVTTNIESQERRRKLNPALGEEHPRAGSTDDVECFFSLLHNFCRGKYVTLKDFQHWWQKLVIQFINRIDPDLPFYFWTSNERYRVDDEPLPSFDETPSDQQDESSSRRLTRLHRLKRRSRTDSSIITPARASVARQHQRSIRQSMFLPPIGLPPIPENFHADAVQSVSENLQIQLQHNIHAGTST